MAWGDGDRIDFNTETLRGQAQVIGGLAKELKDAQTSLRNNIDHLREDWKTAAGNEFFRKFDEDWVSHLDDHIAMLEELVTALQYAADTYEPLATQYSSINIEG